jgi:hypothetical protein
MEERDLRNGDETAADTRMHSMRDRAAVGSATPLTHHSLIAPKLTFQIEFSYKQCRRSYLLRVIRISIGIANCR